MASKILSVRFSQSIDMLKIGGGHTTTVSNDSGPNMPANGVKASLGQMMGEKGIVLRKADRAEYMWVPLSSAILAAVVCVDEPEQVKK